MSDFIRLLGKHNFWDEEPKNLGYWRKDHLQYLESLLDNNLIKVLVGQRRVGKSYILRQFISHLIKERKADPKNILYVNFEIEDFAYLNARKQFSDLIKTYLDKIPVQKEKKFFFFFDEIQEVKAWEKVVNSYLADQSLKVEIFISGSNSNLLSSELATYIAGRYISKIVYPFSYSEYLSYCKLANNKENLIKYLRTSQLPQTFSLQDDERKTGFIRDIKDSILLKDIVQRYKIGNVDLLDKLFLFLANNVGNLFSLNSLVKKLKSLGVNSNTTTLANYIKYFENTFALFGVDRYDIMGKRILEGEKKYYLNDLGFKNHLFSDFDPGMGKILENYVHNTLVRFGFQVYVGKFNSYEIDFIAQKNNRTVYVQVAYVLYGDEVVKREYGNLEKIRDNWEKIVVSLDDVQLSPKEGIKHVQAWHLESFLTGS